MEGVRFSRVTCFLQKGHDWKAEEAQMCVRMEHKGVLTSPRLREQSWTLFCWFLCSRSVHNLLSSPKWAQLWQHWNAFQKKKKKPSIRAQRFSSILQSLIQIWKRRFFDVLLLIESILEVDCLAVTVVYLKIVSQNRKENNIWAHEIDEKIDTVRKKLNSGCTGSTNIPFNFICSILFG